MRTWDQLADAKQAHLILDLSLPSGSLGFPEVKRDRMLPEYLWVSDLAWRKDLGLKSEIWGLYPYSPPYWLAVIQAC